MKEKYILTINSLISSLTCNEIRSSHNSAFWRNGGQFSKYVLPVTFVIFLINLSAILTSAATFNVINVNDSGAGSLRQAIIDANSLSGDDTIVFQNGLNTITLTSGELLITSNITISGNTPPITVTRSTDTGIPNFRIFNIGAGATVTISNLTISGGTLAVTGPGTVNGGGIFNAGTLTIINSTVTNNRAIGSGGNSPSCFGGGIYNTGILISRANILSNNMAVCGSFNNSTGRGGALYSSGSITLTDTEITGNRAEGSIGLTTQGDSGGGGIFSTGSANLIGCSINNNSTRATRASGGGMNVTTVNLTNSTISNNSASSSGSVGFVRGGGIAGGGNINNSTISYNDISTATSGDPSISGGGGVFGNFTFGNTIISNNTISSLNISNSPDMFGTATSQGNNLIGNTAGNSGWIATDLINVNARLTPLGNYGGLTQTVNLLPNSPAIDAGNNALAIDPSTGMPLAFDQRGAGFPRIVDGNSDNTATVDIGALEVQFTPTPTPTPTATPTPTPTPTPGNVCTPSTTVTEGDLFPGGIVSFGVTSGAGSVTVDHVNAGTGLQSLTVVSATNAVVNIPPFTPGTQMPVVVTFTPINPGLAVDFTLRAASTFHAANIRARCAQVCTPTTTVTEGDLFPGGIVSFGITSGPGSVTVDHVDAGTGLRSLTVLNSSNAVIMIPAFTQGTFMPVTVTFIPIDPNQPVDFTLRAASTFHAANIRARCGTPPPPRPEEK